jgi:hypothetical protein
LSQWYARDTAGHIFYIYSINDKRRKMDLRNSALTQRLAEQHCNRGDLDCRWYHGNWELLKSLGVVSTCAVHAKEMSALLQLALREKDSVPTILLSGSTDATLLQIVASACSEIGCQADITAVDICGTPLANMCQYARDNGLAFSSVKADLLAYSPEQRFDIIVTHAFLGNFDTAGRVKLVRRWASMLCKGGSVVTVQRVRPAYAPPIVRFTVDQARQFIRASLAAAERLKWQPDDLARVADAASAFTKHFMSHAITSKTALEKLFLDAGLTLQHLEYIVQKKLPELAGPSVPSGGEFAFIVATRNKPA